MSSTFTGLDLHPHLENRSVLPALHSVNVHDLNSLEGALLHLPSLIHGIDQYINPSLDTAVTLLS